MKPHQEINVLVACEESQAITCAFRERGFNAFSCDLIECSGPLPEYHIIDDAFNVLDGYHGLSWDLLIGHPPCTYLATSGARWLYHPDDKNLPTQHRRPHPRFPRRKAQQKEAVEFFIKMMSAPIPYIALENPVSVLSTQYRRPDCILQPWQFGHEATKTTCLWLKNLPSLQPTNIVGKGEFYTFKSGKRMSMFSYNAFMDAKKSKDPSTERRKIRSKTFSGIAHAIADQYGDFVSQNSQGFRLERY